MKLQSERSLCMLLVATQYWDPALLGCYSYSSTMAKLVPALLSRTDDNDPLCALRICRKSVHEEDLGRRTPDGLNALNANAGYTRTLFARRLPFYG